MLRLLFRVAQLLACFTYADEGTCLAGASCEGNTASTVSRGTLVLPRVIIGCWQLLERHADRAKAISTLTTYAEAGFTAFDTADIYGPSESILGDFRRGWEASHPDSHELSFFTKYVTDDPGSAEARRINSQSLQNLGVPVADLVQFHWWSLSKDGSDKTFLKAGRQLTQLQKENKIKHLAGCNMDTVNLKALVDDGMQIESNQVQYSLLDRRAEVRLLKYCREQGIKLTIFGVVGGGILSDSFLGISKAQAQSRLDSASRRMYWSSLQRWSSDWNIFQRLLQTLRDIGARNVPRLPIAAVACAWALHQLDELGGGGALILGVRDAGHLEEHRALLERKVILTPEDVVAVDAILKQGTPPQGDIWHHERGWA